MPLTIHAPKVESQIQQEAAQQGLTAEEYARRLLERHFQEEQQGEQAAVSTQAAPFHEAASPEEWSHALDAWVETHPSRQPLPEAAFARASFYPNPA